jgi:hypothetical protein
MKTTIYGISTCLMLVLALNSTAQEPAGSQDTKNSSQKGYVVTGNLQAIKSATAFNVVVSPDIQTMGSKGEPDSVYIEKRVREMNDKKAGRGDAWIKEWNETLKNIQPAFLEGLNSVFSKKGIVFGPAEAGAEYTFRVTTGNVLEFMGDIFIALQLDVVKTNDPSVTVATVRFPANWGSSKSKQFDGRAENSYYTAGLLFGKYLQKEVF